MTIMFATVARNEDAYIAEWLAFHIILGVNAFVVFDNDSDDTTSAIARRFGAQYGVRVVPWPTPPGSHFTHYQEAAYSRALSMATDEGIDWLMFTDIDEFTYGENGSTLPERLALVPPDIGAVAVKPYEFGSNYRRDKPSKGLVIENFRRSVPDDFAHTRGYIKTIGRPQSVLGMHDTPHAVLLKPGARYGYPDGSPVEQDSERPGIVNNPKIGGIIQHHYSTKSWAEFRLKQDRFVGKTRRIDDTFFLNREAVCNAVDRPSLVPMAERVRQKMAEMGL